VAIAMRHLRDPVPSLGQRRPDVPPDFEAVILRALEKDPNRRFTSAEEMDAAVAATGLATRSASAPTVVAVADAAPTVGGAMRDHPVGGPGGTEVVSRQTSPGGYRWLPALTAFLVVAAIAAVVVLYLQSRPTLLREAPLPTTSVAPSAAPTEQPASPSATPQPTETPDGSPTPRPDCANLPGLDLPCPDTPPPTQPPTPSLAPPTTTP
jgi:serine/threonine-protein kinase